MKEVVFVALIDEVEQVDSLVLFHREEHNIVNSDHVCFDEAFICAE